MPLTIAPERLVNTVTAGAQHPGDVAVGGRTFTAWIDESSGSAVAKLRVFGPDGAPLSAEITAGPAQEVALAAVPGGFVAVRIVQVGPQQLDVVAQRYDLSGQPQGAPTLVENLDTRNTPTLGVAASGMDVVALSDGGYAVGWTGSSFDSLGSTRVTPNFVVVGANGSIEGDLTGLGASGKGISAGASGVTFAELSDHRVLVTYSVPTTFLPTTPGGQFAQFLDLSGRTLGPAFRIDGAFPSDGGPMVTPTTGITLAGLPGNQVVFAWASEGSVWVSVYPADGVGAGANTGRTPPVRLTTAAGAGEPQVAVLPDGRFIVGYSANGDVLAQVFSGDGAAQGAAMRLGTVSADLQDQLRLAIGPDGTLSALWQDPSGLAGAGGGVDPNLGVKLEIVAFEQNRTGGPDAETFTGGAAADVLNGGAGDDVLLGGGGDDTLIGGVGGDSFNGGSGADRLDGGSNTDFVTYVDSPVGVTVDLAFGFGGGANPTGTDQLISIEAAYGSAFSDVLNGNYLSNVLAGNDGADTIYAASGTDYVDGGAGVDLLNLDATVSDYFVTNLTAQGARLIGPYGTIQASGFERVRIGGQEMSWSEFTSRAFDGLRYVASNPDLIASIGTDAERARQHWMNTGQAEGRPLDTFDPLRYAASNPDLLAQLYIDTAALTRHYIATGFAAGRSATSFDPLQYGAVNPDLLLAFGPDPAALTRHYAASGFIEGRVKTGFDALLYGASNDDLARVFGNNPTALFQNWINSGVFEGRSTTGFDALQYAAANDDLARAFGTDQQAALLHYLNTGADEFRETGGFDTVAYVLSYQDVAGLNLQTALNHWLTVGADQGLRGDELFGREQESHLLQGSTTPGEIENFTTSGRFSADRDWFSVTIGGSQLARISVLGADSGRGTLEDPFIEVYDANGRLVMTDDDSGPGRDAMVSLFNGSRPGTEVTYYIVVRSLAGGEGTYVIDAASGLSSPSEGWIV